MIVETPSEAPEFTTTPVEICVGESVTLEVLNPTELGTGAEWVWYTTSCGGTEVHRGATYPVSPTATTTYYVRAESNGPCANSVCASITVTVYEAPSPAVAGDDQEHCDNATFTLNATAPAVGTGQWSGTLPAGASIADPTLPNTTVTLPAGQTVTLTWTVTNGVCDPSTDQVTLTNLEAIANNTITADQTICDNTAPAALSGSTPTGGNGTYQYQWQHSTTNTPASFTDIAGATAAGYTPGALTATTYYRRVVTSGSCANTSNVITITVNPLPVFTVTNVAAICNTVTTFDVNYTNTIGAPDRYDLVTASGQTPMPGFTAITNGTLPAVANGTQGLSLIHI